MSGILLGPFPVQFVKRQAHEDEQPGHDLRTGEEIYRSQVRFWTRLFAITFAIGVATGITMEFQFGTNWSRYSAYVGDVFGSLLAIEASVAFFLESTFIGVWVFGWKRLSAKAHATVMWLVAGASNLSAIWI